MAERNRRKRRRNRDRDSGVPPGIKQEQRSESTKERMEMWRTRVGIAKRIRLEWEQRFLFTTNNLFTCARHSMTP